MGVPSALRPLFVTLSRRHGRAPLLSPYAFAGEVIFLRALQGVMRVFAATLLLSLLAPSAGALCTEFFCAFTVDEDRDGVPEGAWLATTTFVHDAPSANVFANRTTYFAGFDAYVGEEDGNPAGAPSVAFLAIVTGDNPTHRAAQHAIFVEADAVDPEHGSSRDVLLVAVETRDLDGDGRADDVVVTRNVVAP